MKVTFVQIYLKAHIKPKIIIHDIFDMMRENYNIN